MRPPYRPRPPQRPPSRSPSNHSRDQYPPHPRDQYRDQYGREQYPRQQQHPRDQYPREQQYPDRGYREQYRPYPPPQQRDQSRPPRDMYNRDQYQQEYHPQYPPRDVRPERFIPPPQQQQHYAETRLPIVQDKPEEGEVRKRSLEDGEVAASKKLKSEELTKEQQIIQYYAKLGKPVPEHLRPQTLQQAQPQVQVQSASQEYPSYAVEEYKEAARLDQQTQQAYEALKQSRQRLRQAKFEALRAQIEVDKMDSMVNLFQSQSAEFV